MERNTQPNEHRQESESSSLEVLPVHVVRDGTIFAAFLLRSFRRTDQPILVLVVLEVVAEPRDTLSRVDEKEEEVEEGGGAEEDYLKRRTRWR